MTGEETPDGQGGDEAGHRAEINDSRGVQAGDHNVQTNNYYLGSGPAPTPPASAPAAVYVGDIPWPAPSFQARSDIMAALEPRAEGPGNHRVFAVTGHLGSGKTQLAAAYARRRMAEGWRLVAWVDASDKASILSGLAEVARDAKISDGETQAEVLARKVRQWLQRDGERRLLVFDNATEAGLGALRAYLPVAGSAQVIITSTRAAASDLGIPVRVTTFTRDESLRFLAERTGLPAGGTAGSSGPGAGDSGDGARALAEELGDLPLGLAQAAALINQEGLAGYGVYLKRFRETPVADYLPEAESDPYEHRAAHAIELSLRAVEARDDSGLCAHLTGLLSVLADTGATRQVLYHATVTGAFGDGQTWKEPDVDARLGRLRAASLVEFAGQHRELVSAHRLVMRVIRDRHAAAGDLAEVTAGAVRALDATTVSIGDAWQQQAAARDLAVQVSAVMERRRAHADCFTGDVPGDLLKVRLRSLYLLNELHDSPDLVLEAAEPLADDCARVLGDRHHDTLMAQVSLGVAYLQADRAAAARPVLTRAVAALIDTRGARDLDTLTAQDNLAGAYQETNRTDQAIRLHKQVLDAREDLLGADNKVTLGSRNNLAAAYQRAGMLTDAIAAYARALQGYERTLKTGHHDTLNTRYNLANAYLTAQEGAPAIPLLKQVIADSPHLLGPAHPVTLTARYSLAVAHMLEGDYDPAEDLLTQALPDFERYLGPDHSTTVNARAALSSLLNEW